MQINSKPTVWSNVYEWCQQDLIQHTRMITLSALLLTTIFNPHMKKCVNIYLCSCCCQSVMIANVNKWECQHQTFNTIDHTYKVAQFDNSFYFFKLNQPTVTTMFRLFLVTIVAGNIWLFYTIKTIYHLNSCNIAHRYCTTAIRRSTRYDHWQDYSSKTKQSWWLWWDGMSI